MSDTPFADLLDACKITKWMDLVVERKMPAVTMTDHDNLFALEGHQNRLRTAPLHSCKMVRSLLSRPSLHGGK
jgi:DNA polymerase III alpha subunit